MRFGLDMRTRVLRAIHERGLGNRQDALCQEAKASVVNDGHQRQVQTLHCALQYVLQPSQLKLLVSASCPKYD